MTSQEAFAEMMGLAKQYGLSYQDAASLQNNLLLRELIARAGRPDPNRAPSGPPTLVRVVNVVTANVAVQGPKMVLPEGSYTIVRMRNHATSGDRLGWIAFSSQEIAQYNDSCIELKSNGSNGFNGLIEVTCRHWEDMWFDADTANTRFELISAFGRP